MALYETSDIDKIINASRVFGDPTTALMHIDVLKDTNESAVYADKTDALKKNTLYVTLSIQNNSPENHIKKQITDFVSAARDVSDKPQTYIFTVVNNDHIYSIAANTKGEILITNTNSQKSTTCQTIENALKDSLKKFGASTVQVEEIRPTKDAKDPLRQQDGESCGVFATYIAAAIDPTTSLIKQKETLTNGLKTQIASEYQDENIRPLRALQTTLVKNSQIDGAIDLMAPASAYNSIQTTVEASPKDFSISETIRNFPEKYEQVQNARTEFLTTLRLSPHNPAISDKRNDELLSIPQIAQYLAMKNRLIECFFNTVEHLEKKENPMDSALKAQTEMFLLSLHEFSETGDFSEIDKVIEKYPTIKEALIARYSFFIKSTKASHLKADESNPAITRLFNTQALDDKNSMNILDFKNTIRAMNEVKIDTIGISGGIHSKHIDFKLKDNPIPHSIQLNDNIFSATGKSCDEASFHIMLKYFSTVYAKNNAKLPIIKITATEEKDAKTFIALALEKNMLPVLADKDVVELLTDEQKAKAREIILKYQENPSVTTDQQAHIDDFLGRLNPSSPSLTAT